MNYNFLYKKYKNKNRVITKLIDSPYEVMKCKFQFEQLQNKKIEIGAIQLSKTNFYCNPNFNSLKFPNYIQWKEYEKWKKIFKK